MNRYLEQAAYLHVGKMPRPKSTGHTLSINVLCNLYLDHQESRSIIGEIKLRHLYDQTSLLRDFVRFLGPNRAVSDISTVDLQNYRKKLITPQKGEKPTFTAEQIQTLLEIANIQMKAMIWLGLNCGFGCTDCAELKWKNLDLENDRIRFPRGKTGIERNLPLWPETIQALKENQKKGELVFYTRRGNPS